MNDEQQRGVNWAGLLWFLLIVAVAAGVRFWYLQVCVAGATLEQPPYRTHDVPEVRTVTLTIDNATQVRLTDQEHLTSNIYGQRWFGSVAPLADQVEDTAHAAPGYPWLLAQLRKVTGGEDDVPLIRWIQLGLGALTAGFYFLFARRAFGNLLVAVLAGLFCACYPLYVFNTAEVNSGVLTSFLLAAALMLGTRSSHLGEGITALLYGLILAGLALTRATMLPFAVFGLLWFLVKCRSLQRGWLCAILVVLGFANGVAPWAVRNYQFFQEVIPVTDTAFLHLWIGNNPEATGGPMTEDELRASLPSERLARLQSIESQPDRYDALAADVLEYVRDHPVETVRRRLDAAAYFALGGTWFADELATQPETDKQEVPSWLDDNLPIILAGTFVGMLFLAFLGWRWSYGWSERSGLLAVAMVWIPIPYILSHADNLWGPRIPLDGLLLTLSAFALVYLLPGLRGSLARGPAPEEERVRRREV